MTWGRQVLHVARKDMRTNIWPLLVYVLVVAAAALSSLNGPSADGGAAIWLVVTVITGMFVAGTLVQNDSPARSDAFWVTRPLRPSAVYAAKLLTLAVLVVVPGLVGQAFVLALHEVPGRAVPPLLGVTAVQFGLWLAIAALVAGWTRDARMFVLVFAGTFALLYLSLILFVLTGAGELIGVSFEFHFAASVMGQVAGLVVLFGLLAVQYHRRRVGEGIALAIGTFYVLGLVWPQPVPPPVQTVSAGAPPALVAPVVEARFPLVAGREPGGAIWLRLDGPRPDMRYRAANAVVELQTATGTSRIGVMPGSIGGASQDVPVFVHMEEAAARRVATGDGRLRIRGSVEVAAASLLGELALGGGERLVRDGARVMARLSSSREFGGARLEVLVSVVQWDRQRGGPDSFVYERSEELRFELVDRTGATITLSPAGTNSSGSGLVLPGPPARSLTFSFRSDERGRGLDPEMLRGARLRVYRWVPRGAYPFDQPVNTDPLQH